MGERFRKAIRPERGEEHAVLMVPPTMTGLLVNPINSVRL